MIEIFILSKQNFAKQNEMSSGLQIAIGIGTLKSTNKR